MSREDRLERSTDPVLAAAMAELRADLPQEMDWDRLRNAINERAQLPLARRRLRAPLEFLRPLIPLSAAAGVAFLLWASPTMLEQLRAPAAMTESTAALEEDAILVEALGGDLSEQEFRLLVTGRSNPEALLAFAIGAR